MNKMNKLNVLKDDIFKYKNCNACTNHAECRFLSKYKISRSAIVAILSRKNNNIFLTLGLENYGYYKDTYNMCAGGGSDYDINENGNYCWINNLLRELKEEFKIKLSYIEYKKYFYVNNKSKIIIINNAPCFVGSINVDLDKMNKQVQRDLEDQTLSSCYKEMRDIRNINIFDIFNNNIKISTFAKQVIEKLRNLPIIDSLANAKVVEVTKIDTQ